MQSCHILLQLSLHFSDNHRSGLDTRGNFKVSSWGTPTQVEHAKLSAWNSLSSVSYYHLAVGTAFGNTHVGRVRQSNQDNFLIDEALGLVAVADGMGGQEGGEIASHLALSSLKSFLEAAIADRTDQAFLDAGHGDEDSTWQDENMPTVITLFEAIEFVNGEVYKQNLDASRIDGQGMGTTLTGFWRYSSEGPLVSFHVGDSRLYRFRGETLTQLSRDQTAFQQALEAGASVNLPPRNLLLQAVGPSLTVVPEVKSHATLPGDVYLLCSDGLHSATEDDEIRAVLSKTHEDNLNQSCDDLIDLANGHGGKDNVTIVLVWCKE